MRTGFQNRADVVYKADDLTTLYAEDLQAIHDEKEDVSNKKLDLSDNSDVFYPSQKAVKTAVDAKQNSLGFTPENVANKKTSLAENSDDNYPTQKAVKTAVDAKQNSLGFTPENVANKKTSLAENSDDNYPTQKAVKTAVDAKENALGFTPENVANKSDDCSDYSATKYPTNECVQNALDNKMDIFTPKGYMVSGYLPSSTSTFAASTSYLFGCLYNYIATTQNTVRRIYFGASGTITGFYGMVQTGATASSGQSASLYIRKNNTTDYLVNNTSLTLPANTSQPITKNNLSIAVSAGDYIEFKLVTPAWTTLPSMCAIHAQLYVA